MTNTCCTAQLCPQDDVPSHFRARMGTWSKQGTVASDHDFLLISTDTVIRIHSLR